MRWVVVLLAPYLCGASFDCRELDLEFNGVMLSPIEVHHKGLCNEIPIDDLVFRCGGLLSASGVTMFENICVKHSLDGYLSLSVDDGHIDGSISEGGISLRVVNDKILVQVSKRALIIPRLVRTIRR